MSAQFRGAAEEGPGAGSEGGRSRHQAEPGGWAAMGGRGRQGGRGLASPPGPLLAKVNTHLRDGCWR